MSLLNGVQVMWSPIRDVIPAFDHTNTLMVCCRPLVSALCPLVRFGALVRSNIDSLVKSQRVFNRGKESRSIQAIFTFSFISPLPSPFHQPFLLLFLHSHSSLPPSLPFPSPSLHSLRPLVSCSALLSSSSPLHTHSLAEAKPYPLSSPSSQPTNQPTNCKIPTTHHSQP